MNDPGSASRAVAVDVLVRVEAGAYSNLVLPGVLAASGLPGRDRAFVTDLVYGTLRAQGGLDHLLGPLSNRPLDGLDPIARAALRMGAYQLVNGVAPHAAVSATVGALVGPAARARPFVNAVLRKLAGTGPPWPWPEGDDAQSLAVRTSHPRWIVERLRRDLGAAEALAVLESANHPPPVTLRPNPLRTNAADLAAELRAAGLDASAGALVPDAVVLRGGGDPGRLPAVAEGRATPQDQSSQAVAAAVGAEPGEDILDLAAAPGGKATALAEAMGDKGRVVAADLRPGRVRWIAEAVARLGLASVHPLAADGRAIPFPAGRFDRVLVDAPCSGLGVLRRRPEARWRTSAADVDRLAAIQRELLAAAMATVRPGGLVAYCVCTMTAEETTGIDGWVSRQWPDAGAEPPPSGWRPHGRGGLVLPHDAGSDGMFLLLLRRPAAMSPAT